jgi:hypothetical protein
MLNQIRIANIAVDKLITVLAWQVAQIFKTARVGECIQVDHPYNSLLLQQIADEIRADESRSASDQN